MYDLTGLIGLRYNDNVFYYIKNLQGDIIGILNENCEEVVKYDYDSWGQLLSIKDNNDNDIIDNNNIGLINPFRYRGYYYDSETKLYYLNNRYYNPEFGRFISSDNMIIQSTKLVGNNLYQYAYNNPINYLDSNGCWPNICKMIQGAALAVKNVATVVKYKITNAINSVVREVVRKAWDVVSGTLDYLGMDTSSEMLKHSLQDNPSDITYTTGSRIVEQVLNDPAFQQKVDSAIKKAKEGHVNYHEDITFVTTDLEGSIHGANIYITGELNNGTGTLNVLITDRYDFDPCADTYIKSPKWFIFTVGNNMAWYDQATNGAIQNYDVSIVFDYDVS